MPHVCERKDIQDRKAMAMYSVLQLGFQGRGVPDRALFARSYKNEGTMCHVMCSVSTLGKIFSRRHTIFLIFPRKQHLTFHANCLLWKQFA